MKDLNILYIDIVFSSISIRINSRIIYIINNIISVIYILYSIYIKNIFYIYNIFINQIVE